MKVLLFTHVSDIDGMGCAVLAKLAFKNITYVLCEVSTLNKEFLKYYKNKSIYNFDKIFITDLCLDKEILNDIEKDEKLKNKIFIIDHHKSSLIEKCNDYSFVNIKISDNKGLCSGTSLFYEYLINNNYLTTNSLIEEFTELTREYDTWEWKTKYNNEMAHELSLLFDAVGSTNYIDLTYQKLKNKKTDKFSFNEIEMMLISNKIREVNKKLNKYLNNMYYLDLLNYKAGLVFIDYEYRNDIAEYFREQKIDIDFVMLVSLEHNSISYRTIKENVNVRLIAEHFGGKGHDVAASSPIKEEQKQEIIKILSK